MFDPGLEVIVNRYFDNGQYEAGSGWVIDSMGKDRLIHFNDGSERWHSVVDLKEIR